MTKKQALVLLDDICRSLDQEFVLKNEQVLDQLRKDIQEYFPSDYLVSYLLNA
jgi:hypothetical protein